LGLPRRSALQRLSNTSCPFRLSGRGSFFVGAVHLCPYSTPSGTRDERSSFLPRQRPSTNTQSDPPCPKRCLGFAGAPLDTTCSGRGRHTPYKPTSSRPQSRPPSGRRGETSTEVASPIVSAAPVEMSRLRWRSARHDQGAGERGMPLRSHVVSTRDPTTVGATWRDPHGGSVPGRIRPIRGDVSTALSLRSTRPVAVGGGIPPTNQRRLDQRPAPGGAQWRDPHGGSVPGRIRPIRGGVSASLRSARHDQGRAEGAYPPENTSARPGSRPPSGRSGETPTEVAFPVVSVRFVEMSRLRCASLDTTKGRANEACPYEVTSSRPETRPRRGDVERPPRR